MSDSKRAQRHDQQHDGPGQGHEDAHGAADDGAGGDAAVRRMAGAGGIVPLKPQVEAAIHAAAGKLKHADLKGKHVQGILIGTYIQAGSVHLPKEVDPKGLPAQVFVCMNTGGVARPGQHVDGNKAQHYYVTIGHDTYGPLAFHNPLVK